MPKSFDSLISNCLTMFSKAPSRMESWKTFKNEYWVYVGSWVMFLQQHRASVWIVYHV